MLTLRAADQATAWRGTAVAVAAVSLSWISAWAMPAWSSRRVPGDRHFIRGAFGAESTACGADRASRREGGAPGGRRGLPHHVRAHIGLAPERGRPCRRYPHQPSLSPRQDSASSGSSVQAGSPDAEEPAGLVGLRSHRGPATMTSRGCAGFPAQPRDGWYRSGGLPAGSAVLQRCAGADLAVVRAGGAPAPTC